MNFGSVSHVRVTKTALLTSVALMCMSFVLGAQAQTGDTAPAAPLAAESSYPWTAEREDAVRVAREGDTKSALKVLKKLHDEHPDDIGTTRDYIAVSGWAGHDSEVVRMYKELPEGQTQPDYVMAAVAQSYRDLKEPGKALAIYKEGLKQSPDNSTLIAGEVRSVTDEKNAGEALGLAVKDIKAHGDRVDVLLAASYAAQADNQGIESLRYCFRAVNKDPHNRSAQHDLINAIDFIGAPQEALERANANPGILSPDEYRHLQGDVAAAEVRWGSLEPASEKERFATADKAIATLDTLIAGWTKEGNTTQPNVLRARFDRLIALHDRVRMKDVVSEYEDMTSHNIKVPTYALNAVGDAYLYLHQPEKARDVYLMVLKDDPNNFDANMQLFYAYAETDDFHSAYKQIDALQKNQPV